MVGDLISRSALLADIESKCHCDISCAACDSSDCLMVHSIKNAPGVDTKEAVKWRWISVTEGMPKEHDSIFARFFGTDKWMPGMFPTVSDKVIGVIEYEDGTVKSDALHTQDGEWAPCYRFTGCKVTHWMPMPQKGDCP